MAGEKDSKGEQKPPEPKQQAAPPAPPEPASLDVDYQGSNGRYKLIITVGSSRGGGIATDVLIIAGEQEPVDKPTKPNGLLVYPLPPFTEEAMSVEVQVIGYPQLQYVVTLDGPEKPPEPQEKPRPIAGAGFWANAFRKKL